MKAVILAAGHGTRLWPLSETLPKVMITIGNRPIIDYVVDSLSANSIKEIAVVVGHQKEAIMSHLGDGSDRGINISYYVQQRPLGTAHALLCAKPFLDEPFLVVPGDNLIDDRVVKDALEGVSGNVLVLTQSDRSSEYGVVMQKGKRVTNIIEKPKDSSARTISTGIFKFQPEAVSMFEDGLIRGVTGISSAVADNLDRMDLEGIMTKGEWWDAVYPWDIVDMNIKSMDFSGQEVKGKVEENVTIKGPVLIGRGCRIRSGCYIEGPAIIGDGCDIGPYVSIFPGTSIGHGVRIDPYTHVMGSTVSDAVSIGSHSHISRSMVGRNVSISANFTAASGPADVKAAGSMHPLKDIGAIIGPGCRIEAGVTIRSGAMMGNGCHVSAGVTIRENLKSGTEAV